MKLRSSRRMVAKPGEDADRAAPDPAEPRLRLVRTRAAGEESARFEAPSGHRGRWPLGRSCLGLYEEDGTMYAVRAARGLLGRLYTRTVAFRLQGTAAERRDPAWCEPWKERLSSKRVKTLTLAVRAGAVAFACRPADEQESAPAGAIAAGSSGTGGLSDQVRITVRRKKLLIRATVRREEVEPFQPLLDLDLPRPPACEPAPWSAWRASLHHAPLRPRRGLHLRFLLGPGKGLAVVSSGEIPLGWQPLSWEGPLPASVLFQSHRLLNVFVERRIGLGPIEHVSVQGLHEVKEGWSAVERALGCPVSREPGPAYDGRLIALGAALGSLDPRRLPLDLVRQVQKPLPWLGLVPWGEAAFMAGLAACLFVVLQFQASQMRAQISRQQIRNAEALWAQGMSTPEVKAERDRLKEFLPPVAEYLSPEVRFGDFLASLPSVTPENSTLASAELADEIWKDKADKKRGRLYAVLEATAPFARPEDVDQVVQTLGGTEFFAAHLSAAKVVEFQSRGNGDWGETRFKILSLPKGGPRGAAADAPPAKDKGKGGNGKDKEKEKK